MLLFYFATVQLCRYEWVFSLHPVFLTLGRDSSSVWWQCVAESCKPTCSLAVSTLFIDPNGSVSSVRNRATTVPTIPSSATVRYKQDHAARHWCRHIPKHVKTQWINGFGLGETGLGFCMLDVDLDALWMTVLRYLSSESTQTLIRAFPLPPPPLPHLVM